MTFRIENNDQALIKCENRTEFLFLYTLLVYRRVEFNRDSEPYSLTLSLRRARLTVQGILDAVKRLKEVA